VKLKKTASRVAGNIERISRAHAIFHHTFFIDNKERKKTFRELVAKFDVDKLKISSTLEIHEGSFNT
jgi:hypothetical protein